MFPSVTGDAFMSSTFASVAPTSGLAALEQDPVGRDLLQRSSVPAAGEAPAQSTPATEPLWNFIPMDAETGPHATETEDHDPELERYLVEEIARAKRRRPLMRRLERVEEAYAELPGKLPGALARSEPPPLPPLGPMEAVEPMAHDSSAPANGAHIDQLMEEFGDACTPPPASAEWLAKAQRERRRARLRAFFAWIATLAIGAGIIAATMEMLQR
jgi:hypothetical protein